MTIYQLTKDDMSPVARTTFAAAGIKERDDLQRFFRDQIEIISEDTLIIAEEFGEWEESRRRIDLLGIDKAGNLVVIELKRTEDGGHMELQALRYAAMISTLTYGKIVDIFNRYLEKRGEEKEAEQILLDFLELDEPTEEIASDIRIVLASAEFSKELTTSVLWLCDQGIDICCVRIQPYGEKGKLLLDVQQVIPLPEAEDYQIRVREKKIKEKTARRYNPDLTKYTVTIGSEVQENLPKRRAILAVVKGLCDLGISPSDIDKVIDWKSTVFHSAKGKLNSQQMLRSLEGMKESRFRPNYWFTKDEELIYYNSHTYCFTKRWGTKTAGAMKLLVDHFSATDITFEKVTT